MNINRSHLYIAQKLQWLLLKDDIKVFTQLYTLLSHCQLKRPCEPLEGASSWTFTHMHTHCYAFLVEFVPSFVFMDVSLKFKFAIDTSYACSHFTLINRFSLFLQGHFLPHTLNISHLCELWWHFCPKSLNSLKLKLIYSTLSFSVHSLCVFQ